MDAITFTTPDPSPGEKVIHGSNDVNESPVTPRVWRLTITPQYPD